MGTTGGAPRRSGGALAACLRAALASQKIVSGFGLAIEGIEDLIAATDFVDKVERAEMSEALQGLRKMQSHWARVIGKNRNTLDDFELMVDLMRGDRSQ